MAEQDIKLIAELESRSMSSWTEQELHRYAFLTEQECSCEICWPREERNAV